MSRSSKRKAKNTVPLSTVHAFDDDALADAFNGAATVFHLAAVGSVQRSVDDPQRTFSVNATGTLRVLQAAKKTTSLSGAGVERVILAAILLRNVDDGHVFVSTITSYAHLTISYSQNCSRGS